MTLAIVTVVLAMLAVFLVTLLQAKSGRGAGKTQHIHRRAPLTAREQAMHARLCRTFPDHVVLCQVAFSALISSKQRATRNHFDRKVADFVLCSKAFVVLAVIELDDRSHAGKEKADEARAGWLTRAGYRVVRYAQIPDEARLLADFTPEQLSGDAPGD